MIVEAVVTWLTFVLNGALSLLPGVGHSLDNIQQTAFGFLKNLAVLNGYIPIDQLGLAFGVIITTGLLVNGVRFILASYNLLTKIIP